jgi:hypothetical protein
VHAPLLLLQNGQLKGRVHGADTPTLSSQIQELSPANADVDDLQVLRGEALLQRARGTLTGQQSLRMGYMPNGITAPVLH